MGPKIVEEGNKKWLRLLNDCSGVFRPGILTALVGSSGAGKTTLMDVLAGRKTSEPPPPPPPPPPPEGIQASSCLSDSMLGKGVIARQDMLQC